MEYHEVGRLIREKDEEVVNFVVGFCPFCIWEIKYKRARTVREQ